MSIRPTLAAVLLAAGLPQVATGQESGPEQHAETFLPTLSIREMLVEPLIDVSAEPGTIWARTRDLRAKFDAKGLTVLPAFGKSSPREWPVRVEVASVQSAGRDLDARTMGRPGAEGSKVTQQHVDFTEIHNLCSAGTEQTFVFQNASREGELTIDLSVQTDLIPVVQGDALRFVHPEFGFVECGNAFALDAKGSRRSIPRVWTGDGIRLTVPASFLANATFPVTVDPLWTSFSSTIGVLDDGHPDIVFAGASGRYVVAWEDFTSQQNSDVYMTWWDENLNIQGPALAIETGNDSWTRPSVGYSWEADRVLVAARVGLGTQNCRIEGRLVDVGSFSAAGSPFMVSTIGGTQKESVDVGGSNAAITSQSDFCVTWSRRLGPTNSNIEYRLIETDGTMSSTEQVEVSSANDIDVQISEGLGDTAFIGDYWTLVWTRATEGIMGDIWAKRLYYNGSAQQSSDPILIEDFGRNGRPAVSSLLDAPSGLNGSRAALIVYEHYTTDVTRPSGFRSSLAARTLAGESRGPHIGLTWMEDYSHGLLQERAQVGTNGRAIYISYLEEDPDQLNAGAWNVCMATGELAALVTGDSLCLAERHLVLTSAPEAISTPRMAIEWEGHHSSTSRDGAVIWAKSVPNAPSDFGQLEGRGVSYVFAKQSPSGMVGRQYGDANPNSVGPLNSSWLRIVGDGKRQTQHSAQGRDLPNNVFGFMLVSRHEGSVNLPAGSQGRILLGGSIGRYSSQILSSGQNGSVNFAINPLSIPQGNGHVPSAVGETWRFQLWHRDSVNGMATSNFTNACAVVFTE